MPLRTLFKLQQFMGFFEENNDGRVHKVCS
jgi:hypothetical protein